MDYKESIKDINNITSTSINNNDKKITKLLNNVEKLVDSKLFQKILIFTDALELKAELTKTTYLESLFLVINFFYIYDQNKVLLYLPVEIERWREFLLHLRSSLKLQPRTQLKIFSALKTYSKICDPEVMLILEKIHKPKLPEKKFKALTVEEKDIFFKTANNASKDIERENQSLVLWMLLYGCGLRISEALGLNKNSIIFDASGNGYLNVLGKGNKNRVVPMPAFVEKVLKDYLDKINVNDAENIFKNKKNKALTREHAGMILLTFRRKYSLPDKITLHSLRHTFVTHLLEKNACVRAIQLLAGHASLSTLQNYAHVSLERLQKVHKNANEKDNSLLDYKK